MEFPLTSSMMPWAPVRTRAQRHSIAEDTGMTMVTSVLGVVSKIYMGSFNTTTVFDGHKLHRTIQNRHPGTGVITVSNHTSALDDPLTLAPLIPLTWLMNTTKIRWTMCATNRCFTNAALARLVTFGKALPITRGQGLFQEGMQMALDRLNDGDWLHIFPEGTRSTGSSLLPLKPGIGRLIADAVVPPIVVPFYHMGMENLLEKGKRSLGIGKQVSVLVGDPIHFGDLLEEHKRLGSKPHIVYRAVADRISCRMHLLRAQLLQKISQSPSSTHPEKTSQQ